ncbi:hypothetical protein DRQ53_04880 [bacterium]|nr:MAG: hypothetical protein DRQ32_03545 [bacterium]RKZ16951.1 MAG: hypothetical protein DRQ53_04880 [bacterium]
MYFDGERLVDGAGAPLDWPALSVIGDPVAHSLSPALHAAALQARDIQSRYEAIRVAGPSLALALEAARAAGVRGLNLTLPLKEAVLELGVARTDECERIGAANTLVLRRGDWMAHNTDARGLAMALQRALGASLGAALRRCVILGAGGAARATAHALQGLGAGEVLIAAREVSRADWARDFGGRSCVLGDLDTSRATLVINCTPLGLDPADPPPIDPGALDPDAHLMDLTYGDQPSALLSQFAGRGQDGRAMLVAQAALSFSVWYGALPPLPQMAAAIGMDW